MSQARFLVLSHKHGLLPLAWQLHAEESPLDVMVWHDRYDVAWEGLFEKVLAGREKKKRANWGPLVERAKAGELAVVTDSPQWARRFEDATHLLAGRAVLNVPLAVGAWWDGESYSAWHLLARDLGLWPGGLGKALAGAGAARWLEEPKALGDGLLERRDEVKSSGHRGWVQRALDMTLEGRLEHGEVAMGWEPLQMHLWLAAAQRGTTGGALGGQPQVRFRYSFALPLSVPPWPYAITHGQASEPEVEVEGLGPELRRRVGWHDVAVREGRIVTGRLDGLLGYARAGAGVLESARALAMEVAHTVKVPQLQYRVDGGGTLVRAEMVLDSVGLL